MLARSDHWIQSQQLLEFSEIDNRLAITCSLLSGHLQSQISHGCTFSNHFNRQAFKFV